MVPMVMQPMMGPLVGAGANHQAHEQFHHLAYCIHSNRRTVTVHQNGYQQDPYAKEFGINISEKMTSAEARVLPAPWLKYHDTGKEEECLPQVGQWNMVNNKVINGCKVNHWACIHFSRSVPEATARGFCQELA
uniref:Uncharacterized protein n=1 Tax=Arundo donax TaxID=35708 RepID=A0A0A9CZM4_ARUDO